MKLFIGVIFALFAQFAYADCPQFYPLEKEIDVPHSVELCNSFYAVKYDTELNAPIISVEKFQIGNHPARTNDFHPDTRLPSNRAEKSDYLHSGFDQGHLTPAADAVNEVEEHDTFLLSNMTPQEPSLNRIAWKQLEDLVRKQGPDYIVTGAIYAPNPPFIGANHTPVPDSYYKLIYRNGFIKAFVADNKPHAQCYPIKLEDLETKTGLCFPRY